MPNKPTIAAAIIEANRAKNPVRHVIDYDHRAACMDVLIEAARYREPRKPKHDKHFAFMCPRCRQRIASKLNFCYTCGQALEWSGE